VLAPVTTAIAALQIGDALKILARGVDAVTSRLTTLDIWSGEVRRVSDPERDPQCPCCVRREFPHLDGIGRAPISLCGRNAVQIHERFRPIDLDQLALRLGAVATVRSNQFALRVTLDAYELTVFPDGRAIIKGTSDIGVARSLYARYVGV
jgi:adenylyltransferase/sulfurtransferase